MRERFIEATWALRTKVNSALERQVSFPAIVVLSNAFWIGQDISMDWNVEFGKFDASRIFGELVTQNEIRYYSDWSPRMRILTEKALSSQSHSHIHHSYIIYLLTIETLELWSWLVWNRNFSHWRRVLQSGCHLIAINTFDNLCEERFVLSIYMLLLLTKRTIP